MAPYVCFRCGYTTTHRTSMRLHLNRKTVCKPVLRDVNLDDYGQKIMDKHKIDETGSAPFWLHLAPSDFSSAPFGSIFHECTFCGRSYKHRRNLSKHSKLCKKKTQQKLQYETGSSNIIDDLNHRITEQEHQLETLHKYVNNCTNTITYNNTTNTNNIQVHINIDKNRNNYGNTNYSVLSDTDIRQAINHAGKCIQHIIRQIHFNTNHPENQNIYVSCLKSAVAMMFEGEQWNAHAWADVADRVIDDSTVALQDWMNTNQLRHPELLCKFEQFLKNKDDDDAFMTNLKREIKLLMYNNRKLVHSESMVSLLQDADS